jgi:HAD superfamily hydrolase (TIGR02253 family)
MIKAITFDLDNTLIDFLNFKKKATAAAMDAMIMAGFKGKKKRLKKELFDFYLSHGIESDDIFVKFLKKHDKYSERILAAAINSYLKTKYTMLKSYPKVKQTLRKLKNKGIKLGIVTDARRLKAYIRLDEMGIADMFDVVVGKEDTGREKPSKLPFKKALKLLKVKASETMHVGDWPEKDILGAKRMGMKTCFARYGYMGLGKKVYAEYKIRKFEDVLGVVENGK